jgi:CRISPR-associated protein Cas5/CasD, subtype I-E/ECOLI
MTAFLLATPYAPMASWGDITVGERRTSWDRPSRSAVLGLVAAALGIDRQDQDGHDALDAGYGVAVRVDAPGQVMVDYHTAQTLPQAEVKRVRPRTRRDLIRHGERHHKLETILSWREVRVDAAYTLALWARERARWPLKALADALRAPAFPLYAGRKAHTLGWPLLPEVVEAPSLAAALASRAPLAGDACFDRLRAPGGAASVSCDYDSTIDPGLDGGRLEIRRDTSPHRTRWHFAERRVMTGRMPDPVSTQDEQR